MGSCACAKPTEQVLLHNMIHKEIADDKKRMTKIQKVLFLGTNGSGKSALFKQMRIKKGEFRDEDKKRMTKIQKVLFLGTNGSGKSALFKQMRIKKGEFRDEDKKDVVKHIHLHVINEMKLALNVYIDYNHRKEANYYKYDHDDDEDDNINLTSTP
eukprot:565567_1